MGAVVKSLFVAAAVALFARAAVAQGGSIDVADAWARATPAGAQNGAAYATIESPTPDRLTGVSSPVAAKAELHRMTMDGNIMKMRQIAGLDLPAGKPVTLKPGEVHIMLLGLKRQLKPGDKFPLTLDFAKAGERQVQVTVEGVGAMGPSGHNNAGTSMKMPMPAQH